MLKAKVLSVEAVLTEKRQNFHYWKVMLKPINYERDKTGIEPYDATREQGWVVSPVEAVLQNLDRIWLTGHSLEEQYLQVVFGKKQDGRIRTSAQLNDHINLLRKYQALLEYAESLM